MSKETLESFKKFVKSHPKLIKEVRGGNKTWKEIYEEWYFLGEEDEKWKAYKQSGAEHKGKKESSDTKSAMMDGVFSKLKNMDLNEVQKHITQISAAIDQIQQLVQQFQPQKPKVPSQSYQQPFHYRHD
ncbi:YlbD family protein [Bacillus taeanensis]|uniref:YlbD family protein n=1 Tax=Bacillus taeanensis TaxID=273032 RepID=UPI001FE33882|nr:YlbD family protein [Bacillus taeanensis]